MTKWKKNICGTGTENDNRLAEIGDFRSNPIWIDVLLQFEKTIVK